MTALERARELHSRGVAAIARGRPEQGARLYRSALSRLPQGSLVQDRTGDALRGRILISLAAAEVFLGNRDAGFARLDEAGGLVAPRDRGILLDQRGWMLLHVGRMDEALRCMDEAIPMLEAGGDLLSLTRSLLNRAMLHQLAGRVRLARADLRRCEDLARDGDLPRLLAKARLNLGHCEVLTGDIPAALRAFEAARPGLTEHAPAVLQVLAVDRARALLGAGMAGEAAAELDSALAALSGSTHERAEAELIRAQAALAQRDLATARTWALRAERRFRRRGNETWAAVAVLTRLRADFEARRSARKVAARAAELANTLRGLNLRNDAEIAALLAARAFIAIGDLDAGRAHLTRMRTTQATLETKLLRRLATAELHTAEGDRAKARGQARAGLTVLHQQRSRLGSIDLQTGSAALGLDLARLGLANSLRDGSAIFGWLERTRAQAFQVRPVRPLTDPAITDAVAALRQAAVTAREAELAGRRDVAAERRCAELERSIRAHSWQADGSGEHQKRAVFGDVAAELDRQDSVLASYFVDGDRLGALVVVDGAGVIVRAGAMAEVTEAVARLRADLDAVCGRALPKAIMAVVEDSIAYHCAVLAEHLVVPMGDLLKDRDLVVVPTGSLASVPWNLLPGLRGRPVTVAVSASAWSASARGPFGPFDDTLLVAGPGLAHAEDEVRKIAELLPNAEVLGGPDATVAATLAALPGRRSVHFATHGHHEPGNFFFSRLDLADGPLMAYDIHHLSDVPEHVVLSSCDVGRTVVRSGDEMLGFTAALLYSGTTTVVAGVARIPDDAALSVMTTYQESLARGVRPARALADATRCEPAIPLVCFGYG